MQNQRGTYENNLQSICGKEEREKRNPGRAREKEAEKRMKNGIKGSENAYTRKKNNACSNQLTEERFS